MTLRIGHRGAAGYEPENTLRSFQKALDLGVDMIELDVHVCKSGEIVVIHDDTVARTTSGQGQVSKMTLDELRSLDAGKGEKIPVLEEVLNLINRKVPINIELKGKHTAKPVFSMIENYVNTQGWSYDDFLISSFSNKELKKFQELCGKIKIGYLTEHFPALHINFAKKIKAYSINPVLKKVTKKFIDKAHSNGLAVFVWTVNEKESIERLKSWGVDGIFSNYPDRI